MNSEKVRTMGLKRLLFQLLTYLLCRLCLRVSVVYSFHVQIRCLARVYFLLVVPWYLYILITHSPSLTTPKISYYYQVVVFVGTRVCPSFGEKVVFCP